LTFITFGFFFLFAAGSTNISASSNRTDRLL